MKNKKITLIDVLIVLVVIIAGVVIKGVLAPSGANNTEKGKTEFVVLASFVDNKLADNLKEGTKAIIDHADKTEVKIESIEKKPAEIMILNQDSKQYNKTESQIASDLYITVSSDNATVTENKIKLDDVFIRVGGSIWLDTKELPIHGTIVKINSDSKE